MMKIKFKRRWQAILFSKLLWVKTIIINKPMVVHEYGTYYNYKSNSWAINQIIILKKK